MPSGRGLLEFSVGVDVDDVADATDRGLEAWWRNMLTIQQHLRYEGCDIWTTLIALIITCCCTQSSAYGVYSLPIHVH